MDAKHKRESVEAYYGKVLQKTGDLKTNACCSSNNLSDSHKKVRKRN